MQTNLPASGFMVFKDQKEKKKQKQKSGELVQALLVFSCGNVFIDF